MKIFGFKFAVFPSRVREKRKVRGLSYAALVKNNALKKAKDVAARVKSGIVIAADTITVQDKKIYGKPANLKAARAMLKKLTRKPQWVYTGIAVVDKDKNKSLVSYEKTKVYMDELGDREIAGYFSRASPIDKAGGFDIQGKGALFVRGIEGCFYNVVGLPIRKLYYMLKELNVKIFSFFLCLCVFVSLCPFLSGCSTEYNIVTGKEEVYFYSTDKEVQMGVAIAKEVESQYKLVDDPLVQKRVQDIGKKIAAASDRREIDYYFKVLEDDEINAFALPGGFVYVNKGLLEKVSNDDELACILGHEVGHIVARHGIKKLQAIMGYSLIRVLTAVASRSAEAVTAADLAFTEILLGYGREDELVADQLGSRYAKKAGYNPRSMITFLERLEDINRRKPPRQLSYFKTHPYVPDRIREVKQELGERIDFTDYINIEQKKDAY
jgi:MAF protein